MGCTCDRLTTPRRFEIAAVVLIALTVTGSAVFAQTVEPSAVRPIVQGDNLNPIDTRRAETAPHNNGVRNQESLTPILHAAPPLWPAWRAFVAYLVAIAALVTAAVRHYAGRLARQAERTRWLEREMEDRTRELAEQNRQLADLNEKLRQASFTDSLTELWNRRFLVSQIVNDLALVHRAYVRAAPPSSPSDLLFMMLDLDGLKGINDTWGHRAGDCALVQVGDILRRVCRQSDTLIRWGGDEFLIVGRNTDQPSAQHIAERIKGAVEEHLFDLGDDNTARLSCSVGFAFYPFVQAAPKLLTWECVVGLADRALYLAKQRGRNTWVGVFSAPDTDAPTLMTRLEEDLVRLADEGVVELRMPTAAQTVPQTEQPGPVPLASDPRRVA
jgi:diguanylate cyclase (GGDEF)-like protein